jgi:hypothetical protein
LEPWAHFQDLRRAWKRASDSTITPATAKRKKTIVFIGRKSPSAVEVAMGDSPRQVDKIDEIVTRKRFGHANAAGHEGDAFLKGTAQRIPVGDVFSHGKSDSSFGRSTDRNPTFKIL